MIGGRGPGRRSGLRERKKLAVRHALGSAALRPAGEPLWEAISHAVLAHYEGAGQAPDGEWMARLKLVLAAPAIRGEYLKVTSEMQETLAEAIATRTGTDIGQDMYPRILAGAVIAAAQVAVRRWSAADPPMPLGPLLRRALEQLATACSQPKAGE